MSSLFVCLFTTRYILYKSYFLKLHEKWRHTGVSQVETIPQKNTMYTTVSFIKFTKDDSWKIFEYFIEIPFYPNLYHSRSQPLIWDHEGPERSQPG